MVHFLWLMGSSKKPIVQLCLTFGIGCPKRRHFDCKSWFLSKFFCFVSSLLCFTTFGCIKEISWLQILISFLRILILISLCCQHWASISFLLHAKTFKLLLFVIVNWAIVESEVLQFWGQKAAYQFIILSAIFRLYLLSQFYQTGICCHFSFEWNHMQYTLLCCPFCNLYSRSNTLVFGITSQHIFLSGRTLKQGLDSSVDLHIMF